MNNQISFLVGLLLSLNLSAQKIGDFTSLQPLSQNSKFIIPSTHVFQKIIEEGAPLTSGAILPGNTDFTGYVPIGSSSEKGYLSISSELTPGGVTVMDVDYNSVTKLWEKSNSKKISFSTVAGTERNCSGTVTPWNTVITCEEEISTSDVNQDGRYDIGWCVEIDPAAKTVIDKRWALGNFKHENIVVHNNKRTVYEGADSNPGYLYKFVADSPEDLSSGKLYVYKGSKNGTGHWVEIQNSTPAEQNSTLSQSLNVGATVFDGIEDVEIGPDGLVYFAVKGEGIVYRFQDSDPLVGTTVLQMETFVGNASYMIDFGTGSVSTSWGNGNDNLAFDGDGNLWVLQDGGKNFIWVVGNDHTQSDPKVKIFGRTPAGSEPTGITFTPDFKFLFMSIQHPNSVNGGTSQIDAEGNVVRFDKDISLAIALRGDLGGNVMAMQIPIGETILVYPNPSNGLFEVSYNNQMLETTLNVYSREGKLMLTDLSNSGKNFIDLAAYPVGMYYLEIVSEGNIIGFRKLIKK